MQAACLRKDSSLYSCPYYFEGPHQSKKCSPLHLSSIVWNNAGAQYDTIRLSSCVWMYANCHALLGCRMWCGDTYLLCAVFPARLMGRVVWKSLRHILVTTMWRPCFIILHSARRINQKNVLIVVNIKGEPRLVRQPRASRGSAAMSEKIAVKLLHEAGTLVTAWKGTVGRELK